MNFTIISMRTGRVEQIVSIDLMSISSLSIKDGSELIGLDAKSLDAYWNGIEFIQIHDPPANHQVFDYELKQWIDPRTLDQVQKDKWGQIKYERDAFEFGGFEFESNIYDSDQVSQSRIISASKAGISQIWTLANNETIELSANQLIRLYQCLQLHIAFAHERGRVARQLIYEADSLEKVQAVIL